jgi:phenylpropionate dioxygenase-like ring-hydroxylating dioxygenase large terminal subunit
LNTWENKEHFKQYWYIACQSKDLNRSSPISRTIMDEWLVIFRDENGAPVALQDRCPHRNFKLSEGSVKNGCIQCPYHGWTLDKNAEVINVPAEGPNQKTSISRAAKKYSCIEQDDFIYVKLAEDPQSEDLPFRMPKYKQQGYETVRLFNIFKNNVLNCAENYVDVPHTVFVHDKIFRVSRQEKVEATIERVNGSVIVDYKKETDNLGWFSWFLNPKKTPIKHIDHFHMPNVTSVDYIFGPKKEFYITSHCTPVSSDTTYVYTDLTYKFGLLNTLAKPIVRYQGQSVIDQDKVVLKTQMDVIKKYGTKFQNTKADLIHIYIESLRNEIGKGNDPKLLPYKKQEIEFWI